MFPVFLITFFMIHEVAEPHMINTRSPSSVPLRFQKSSNATRKSDLFVANHGNSSRNTIFFPFGERRTESIDNILSSLENASNQFLGAVLISSPYSISLCPNDLSLCFAVPFSNPTALNANSLKVCSTRNVFPTLRLP